jgi:molybdenum cofactor cytidylyltransferase
MRCAEVLRAKTSTRAKTGRESAAPLREELRNPGSARMTTALPQTTSDPLQRRTDSSRLFALVLAAGSSSRFGSTKQLARYQGAPLVNRAIHLAESVCGSRSVLVAGHEWRSVVEACGAQRGFFVNNTRYASGMGSSIACGVRSVSGAADAVLLILADQPLVTRRHLEELRATWIASPDEIVASSFSETTLSEIIAPPVIFPRRYFSSLRGLEGDRGARDVLALASPVRTLRLEEASADVDRPEDIGLLP